LFQDIDESANVDVGVVLRIPRRRGYTKLRSVMNDHVRLELQKNIRDGFIADVEFEELRPGIDVCPPAAAVRPKVVDDSHLVTSRERRVSHVRPDEARTAGNQNPHEGLFCPAAGAGLHLLVGVT
jgi:hypothetical protein